jgi:hypothetical protein
VYVYRDPELAAEARDRDERDAAYWYDLSGEQAAPAAEETRGPFEPLVPSSGQVPPAAAPRAAAEPAAAEPEAAGPEAGHGGAPDDTAESRARKLEQIKDFYLTAEAIGEQNVDKHFDQLLAQQRELISEYFKQPGTARPDAAGPRDGAAQGQADQARPGGGSEQQGDASSSAHGAGIAAEQPRAW